MRIYHKNEAPAIQPGREVSMYVFIYYCNNRRFTFGRYDFTHQMWYDLDSMPLEEDFIWCYLPIKQMKTYLRVQESKNNNTYYDHGYDRY